LKALTSVTIESETLKQAKKLNINISRAAEEGIKRAIEEQEEEPDKYLLAWKKAAIESQRRAKKLEKSSSFSEIKKMQSLDRDLYNLIYLELKKAGKLPDDRVVRTKKIKEIFYSRFGKEEGGVNEQEK